MQHLTKIFNQIIGFFYKPFSPYLSREVFTYALCGGANMLLDWVLYFITYNFIIGHKLIYISIFSLDLCLTPHIASFCIVFPITLFTGFWLNKNITFTQSSLHTVSQAFRYLSIVALNLGINYVGLKVLVEMLHWYPTPSKMVITIFTILISFFGQKYYSFRK